MFAGVVKLDATSQYVVSAEYIHLKYALRTDYDGARYGAGQWVRMAQCACLFSCVVVIVRFSVLSTVFLLFFVCL